MSEQSTVRRKSPLSTAAAVTIEGLELRSLFNSALAITANTPTPKVFQGEIVQTDFNVPANVTAASVTGWTISWGDGSTSHLAANRSHATHQYSNTGLYSATISAQGVSASAATVPFKIVNAPPEVAITNVPATGIEGTAISLSGNVIDAGSSANWTYGWTVWRDGKHFIVPDGTDITSSDFTFTPTDNGNYVARLTVLDGQGGMTTVRSLPIAVANAAPTGSIAGTPHRTVDDGRTVYLTADASDPGAEDTLSYNWTVTEDGQPIDLSNATARTISLAGLDDGSYVVNCTVTDNDGAATVLAPASFDVATTLPPTAVTIGGLTPSGEEGTAVNAYATAFGPSASPDDTYRWSVTRDGQAYSLPSGTDTGSSSFTFTPDNDGEYVVKVIASDDNGIFSISTSAVTVANVPPTVTISGEPTSDVNEGSAVHLSTAVTDPGTLDTHTYAWTITKDGQAWTPSSNTVLNSASLTFTPSDNGVYVASVTVSDGDGGVTTAASQSINVINVPPVATITGEPTGATEGSPITLGSTVTDAGTDDTESYEWSITKNGQSYAMASTTDLNSATFTFVPNDNGTYVATLKVTDKDGGQDIVQSSSISVANVPPTGTISGVSSANEGDDITLTAYGSDVGTADTLSYAWHATRDGQAVSLGSANAAALDYTPRLAGNYVFTVSIRDDDGGQTDISQTVAVADVAPIVAVTGPGANAGQGDTLTYTGSAADPGTDETLTYTWAVKRDGTLYTLPSDVATNGSTLSFIANDPGNYVAYLTVTDGVGGMSTSNSGITTVASVFA